MAGRKRAAPPLLLPLPCRGRVGVGVAPGEGGANGSSGAGFRSEPEVESAEEGVDPIVLGELFLGMLTAVGAIVALVKLLP